MIHDHDAVMSLDEFQDRAERIGEAFAEIIRNEPGYELVPDGQQPDTFFWTCLVTAPIDRVAEVALDVLPHVHVRDMASAHPLRVRDVDVEYLVLRFRRSGLTLESPFDPEELDRLNVELLDGIVDVVAVEGLLDPLVPLFGERGSLVLDIRPCLPGVDRVVTGTLILIGVIAGRLDLFPGGSAMAHDLRTGRT